MSDFVTIASKKAPPQQWRSIQEREGKLDTQGLHDQESPNGQLKAEVELNRRGFMGVTGVTLAAAASALSGCIRKDREYIVPLNERPEDYVPGRPAYFTTAAQIGGEVQPLLIKSQDGRPIKIDGNPRHPEGAGGSSNAWAQATIMDLYDPDRLTRPMRAGEAAGWDAWEAFAAERMKGLKAKGGDGFAVLMEDDKSPTVARLIAELRSAVPLARFYRWDDTARTAATQGAALVGVPGHRPRYDLSKAAVILTLDSDFLGTDGSLRLQRQFTEGRRVESIDATMNRLYAVESFFSNTGMSADNRLRLPSSQIRNFLIALAKALFAGGVPTPAGASKLVDAMRPGPLGPTEEQWVQVLAADLIANAGGSAILVGERQPASVHALANLVNAALGNVGSTVAFVPSYDATEFGDIGDLVKQAGFTDTLLILGGNPAERTPASLGLAAAIKQVPHSIHLTSSYNATAQAVSWALPQSHYLEAWGDLRAGDGSVTIQQPLLAPMYGSRSTIEVLKDLLGRSGHGHGEVQATWNDGGDFESQWRSWLYDGRIPGTAADPVAPGAALAIPAGAGAATVAFDWSRTAAIIGTAVVAEHGSPLELGFLLSYTLADGRYGNNPWLLELPDPVTKLTWDNAALMSPSTARAAGVDGDGDFVNLEIEGRSLDLPAWVVPGMADNVVLVQLGWNESAAGRYGEGYGFAANTLRNHESPWFQVGVGLTARSRKHVMATVQHHHRLDPGFNYGPRPLVRENTLAEFRKTPDFVENSELLPADKLKSLWVQPNETGGQQWGMTIDLNSCTGCGTCTVACQAENNVQVVGKERVSEGREMAWIRIDRYFTGDPENPEMVMQPVACAHCETAPCEGVCPVGATVHGPEGLNDIAYNRCIGTRYCANNCPYKVRRYNFFAYSKDNYEANDLVALQRNPDVTVRFRGVVEKCSYCVQRINTAKIAAKRDGTRFVKDGAITPACAQACPGQAITFGDINDPTSRVALLKRNPRNYAMLAELNIHPRTTYLARLRNPNPELA